MPVYTIEWPMRDGKGRPYWAIAYYASSEAEAVQLALDARQDLATSVRICLGKGNTIHMFRLTDAHLDQLEQKIDAVSNGVCYASPSD